MFRAHSIARTSHEPLDSGYDYNETLSNKYSSPSRDATVPIVNVVNNNADIVYVPMVKTEFIKRESKKIENLGNLAYQSQGSYQPLWFTPYFILSFYHVSSGVASGGIGGQLLPIIFRLNLLIISSKWKRN